MKLVEEEKSKDSFRSDTYSAESKSDEKDKKSRQAEMLYNK